MKISFSPQFRDDSLEVTKNGDVLTINGEVFDFSVIPEGSALPCSAVSSEFVAGDITRTDGELHITLLLPHGPDPIKKVAFPADITNVADGLVEIPRDLRKPAEVPSDV